MCNRHTAQALGVLIEATFAFLDDLRAATNGRVDQLVRLFRGPSQATRFPKDLNVEPMLTANCHGRRPKPSNRAALHTEIHHRVVFQLSAGDGRGEISGKRFHLVIANEARHMQSVDAAICELA